MKKYLIEKIKMLRYLFFKQKVIKTNPIVIKEGRFNYDAFFDGIEMEKYNKIRILAGQIGYSETRTPYLFQFQNTNSYMAWSKKTNSFSPCVYDESINASPPNHN